MTGGVRGSGGGDEDHIGTRGGVLYVYVCVGWWFKASSATRCLCSKGPMTLLLLLNRSWKNKTEYNIYSITSTTPPTPSTRPPEKENIKDPFPSPT